MTQSARTQIQVASFLVRVRWEEAINQTQADFSFQGEVEHIQSGRRWVFGDLADLVTLIQSQVEKIGEIKEQDGE